ncbi:hypothetical protein [Polaribacter sp. R77954]|uniref:hypothetical protein n=1 Tax=Polaribacter sp. R77954 TaxID=3093870 RepID=UPI0037C644BD
MKVRYLLITITLFLGLCTQAQNTTKTQLKTAVSIYTFSSLSKNTNSISNLNKKLNLKNIQFGYVGHINSDFNRFPLFFQDLSQTPSDFIYDYKRFQDRNIPIAFLVENNPTFWNLQCPNPLSVQPTE